MMHPEFRQSLLHDHQRDLDRRARRALRSLSFDEPRRGTDDPVVLRLCCVHDDEALERLAALEGRSLPTGRFIVAEVGGIVVAALPLGCGGLLADPFRPTAQLVPLLELRADQLGASCTRRGRLAALGSALSWSRA